MLTKMLKAICRFQPRRAFVAAALVPTLLLMLAFAPGQSLTALAADSTADVEVAEGKFITVTIVERGVRSEHEYKRGAGSVEEFLLTQNIALRNGDTVSPDKDELLTQDTTIKLRRMAFITRKVREPMPFRTLSAPSPELAAGAKEILSEGREGLRDAVYAAPLLADGSDDAEFLHEQTVLEPAVDEIIATGFKVKPVSTLDFEAQFDENGEPAEYVEVLRGQRAAGYSARAGAKTASGMYAIVGHVAVDPNVIPYGSKLFIQSSDGKFIYGYAIAADTGLAIKDGRIAVDLFYGSYAESAANGIKSVDIFVLE